MGRESRNSDSRRNVIPPPPPPSPPNGNPDYGVDDLSGHHNDKNGTSSRPSISWNEKFTSAAATVPHIVLSVGLRTVLGVTVALYVLNQQHVLPRPLSALVSKTLFWPTLPITASRRMGQWMTRIDDTVVMGGAPFGFLHYPKILYRDYRVRGVINMCEEYRGPLQQYKDLGIDHLHLPTTDHFEPSVEDLMSAIAFIQRQEAHGNAVYVHCRAGHGRSAAAVLAWLLYKEKDPSIPLQDLNGKLLEKRNVRKTLWKQPNLLKFQSRLQDKGRVLLDVDDDEIESPEAPE